MFDQLIRDSGNYKNVKTSFFTFDLSAFLFKDQLPVKFRGTTDQEFLIVKFHFESFEIKKSGIESLTEHT